MDGKRYIPGTNPKWGVSLPEGYSNSLVDEAGRNHDNGYNFDERDDDDDVEDDNSFEMLSRDRDFLERVKEKTSYAGLFVDKDELYGKAPAHLENVVEYPHVTTNFAPNETQLHLDELGSKARVFAVGYGNNGKNEGLLVKVESEDPVIQAAVDAVEVPHITLSYSNDSHAMYTAGLEFSPLEKPFEIDGEYSLYLKSETGKGTGGIVNDIDTLKKSIQ